MLGKKSGQKELFRPDHIYGEHVGRETFYGLLSSLSGRLFRDGDFAGLYGDRGRPSVPPSQLCVALLLQAHEGVSDEEAIQRTAYDLRWKVALGLELDEKLCAKSTLQLFRAKLILNEEYQRIFQASVEACRDAQLLKRKKLEIAVDTTPVFGRGAVKDTFNLVSDQIREVMTQVVALKGGDLSSLASDHGLSDHFGTSYKRDVEIDWGNPDQKRALVGELVSEAKETLELSKAALRGYSKNAESTQALRRARELLAELLLQDIEEDPEDGEGPQIRQATSRDRVISTTDPEMRHGRKSHSKTFNGFKASVVAETSNGVIVATDVRAGNIHDSEGTADLVREASRRCKQKVKRVLGDTAYGSIQTRREIDQLGAEVIAKVAPLSPKHFTINDFRVDSQQRFAVCPSGKKSSRRDQVKHREGWRFMFSRSDCLMCNLRSKCTSSDKAPRSITIGKETPELQRLRRRQRTKAFLTAYRRRIIVEHRIARIVQLGARQARYFGLAKVAFQISIIAAVANLGLVNSRAKNRLDFTRRLQIRAIARVIAFLRRRKTRSRSWTATRELAPEPGILIRVARCRPAF